jgi:hypothetical protein
VVDRRWSEEVLPPYVRSTGVLVCLVLLVSSGCSPERVDDELLSLPDGFNVVKRFEMPNQAGGPELISSYLVVEPAPESSVDELVTLLRRHYEQLGFEFETPTSGRGELFGSGRGLAVIGAVTTFLGERGSTDADTIDEEIAGLEPSDYVLVVLGP